MVDFQHYVEHLPSPRLMHHRSSTKATFALLSVPHFFYLLLELRHWQLASLLHEVTYMSGRYGESLITANGTHTGLSEWGFHGRWTSNSAHISKCFCEPLEILHPWIKLQHDGETGSFLLPRVIKTDDLHCKILEELHLHRLPVVRRAISKRHLLCVRESGHWSFPSGFQ